ncbi:MAG: twin-arginine translocase subunit TatC [Lentisphaeria bacterium]|nr:twin-arginine translocase subunit TatC [Lentisphaeria bacterium]
MDDTKLSVLDHLEEMRLRMLKCIACVVILFPLCFMFCDEVINWFLNTFCPSVNEVQTLQVMELFFTQMKVGVILAVILAYPVLAYQTWRFVAPGLYKKEQYYISRCVFLSTALFVIGAAFALFVVFPMVLRFGLGMASGKIVARPQLRSVINMASMLMLGFGVMFQLPIVVYVLAVTEIVSLERMRKARPIIVVVIFTLAAILTPPDVISQCALGFPALFLFEISLWVSARALRKKHEREAEERRAEEALEAAEAKAAAEAAAATPPLPAAEAPEQPAAAAAAEPAAQAAVLPDADGVMPGTPTTADAAAEHDPYANPDDEGEDWEEWYGNVDDGWNDAQHGLPKGSLPPGAPDPYDDGPAGSGQV